MIIVGNPDVIEDGHLRPKAYVLESPGNSGSRNLMGKESHEVLPFDLYLPMGGTVNAADEIEDGCLSGAVRPDKAKEFSSFQGEVEIRDSLEPAEKVGQPAYLKKRHEPPAW
jgi:hypothetical protein